MFPTRYGPAVRRPGTYYVAEVKDSSKATRLLPFKYSTVQAYILEAGDAYFRFYKDRGQIQTGTGTEDLSAFDSAVGDSSLVAHWLLNDNLGTQPVLDDAIAGTHDGTMAGTTNTDDVHATGKVGTGCFNLNGIDAVEVGDNVALSFGNGTVDSPFSLMALVYVTNTAGNAMILTKWNKNGKREWGLYLSSDSKLALYLADQSVPAYPYRLSDESLTGGWHVVMATYTGQAAAGATAANLITLYVDGIEVDSTANNDAAYDAMENLGSDVSIGGAYDATEALELFWPDKIDNVAIFSKELSAAEVASLNSGTETYEIVSPYAEDDLFGLQRIQSANVMYSFHSGYNPRKLKRYAHDDWELESITFDWPPFMTENATDTTITVTGAGAAPLAVDLAVTMTASASLFTKNHIDSFWLIRHPRTADETVQPNKVGSAEGDDILNADGEVTDILKDVKGSWKFRTAGVWSGQILIERSYDDGASYHTLETLVSNNTEETNFITSGEEETGDAWLRARILDNGTIAVAGACEPTLSCERFYHYGIVKVTAFTSATVVTGEVVRIINSEVATKLFSEGSWSDERGYPSSGRTAYGGRHYL
jgi:hypothetical protein